MSTIVYDGGLRRNFFLALLTLKKQEKGSVKINVISHRCTMWTNSLSTTMEDLHNFGGSAVWPQGLVDLSSFWTPSDKSAMQGPTSRNGNGK